MNVWVKLAWGQVSGLSRLFINSGRHRPLLGLWMAQLPLQSFLHWIRLDKTRRARKLVVWIQLCLPLAVNIVWQTNWVLLWLPQNFGLQLAIVKSNKPFLPLLMFVRVLCHTSRKETRQICLKSVSRLFRTSGIEPLYDLAIYPKDFIFYYRDKWILIINLY